MPDGQAKVVFFDVGGTLIAPQPSLPEIYRRVLLPLGIDCDAAVFRQAAVETWGEFDALVGRGGDRYSHFPGGERTYWRRYVARLLGRLANGHRAAEAEAALHAAFSDPAAWAVFPEARETLKLLKARGLRLGVISNWDSRLRRLLGSLALAGEFEAIVVSCEVGVEKPSRAIFESALGTMGVRPGEAFHVGDDLVSDYDGARAAGIGSALIVRRGAPPGGVRTVASLAEIVPIVCSEREAPGPGRGAP